MRNRTVNDSEVFPVHIIDNVIRAIVQASQFQPTLPIRRVERVIHLLIFADHVRFRQIETNIVERA